MALGSCKKGEEKRLFPNVTGDAGEVVLMINQNKWESKIGLEFRKILLGDQIGLPQPEPLFDLVNIPHSAFSKIFQPHRNLIFAKISSEYKEPKITIQTNLWSKTQLVINMVAPNDSSFLNLIIENKEKIVTHLLNAERRRILSNYKKYEERHIREQLQKNHSLSLIVPKGYTLNVDSSNFVWISHETSQISQGIFVYYYDYVDTNTFTVDYLLNKRNIFLKKHVPGPSPNSYMTTERNYKPNFIEFEYNNRYFAELRGLYRVENNFYGGPFMSVSTIDEKRNRVVTVEGFVYAPQLKKRNYLRQLEAILYTLEIK